MNLESYATIAIAAALIGVAVVPYFRKVRTRERMARRSLQSSASGAAARPVAMYPSINELACIGCGSCARACPEGDVLGVIAGRAMLVKGEKCVGHGLCADACPVGAITLTNSGPGRGAYLPILTDSYETSVQNVFIIGELGGVGLIKNAVSQGVQAIDGIAKRPIKSNGIFDVAIVGAGPAGLAAALRAKQHGMKYILLEQGEFGGSILHYPRRKVVMTSPVEIPLWGKFRRLEISKEELLETWQRILEKTHLAVQEQEKVLDIGKDNGRFSVKSSKQLYAARHVVLALGRRGTPRKLGVPGEHLDKVMYRLIEPEAFRQSHVLVVGGGDSAVEAALGLASEGSIRVTMSYRKGEFSRIKERNALRIKEHVAKKTIEVLFNSEVREIAKDHVSLRISEAERTVRNDHVFVFAGGEMPFDFLRNVGIAFHE